MIGLVMCILTLIVIGFTVFYSVVKAAVKTGIIEALDSCGLRKDKISAILTRALRGGVR